MFTLWIGAILLTALAAWPVIHLSSRPATLAADPSRDVYRRQLAEIDDLAARGVLAKTEVKSAHAEAARRLLGADAAVVEAGPSRFSRLAVLTAVAVIGLGSPAIYLIGGSPDMADKPFAKRLAAWSVADPATLEPEEMIARLSDLSARAPKDVELLFYLAREQTRAGDAPAAIRTLSRAVKITPGSADLWTLLGQLRVADAEGVVTPEAREAFARAAVLDPKAETARQYLARAAVEAAGSSASPAGNPAILAMVEGLAVRLQAQPNDPAGWERLVRSWRVLGDEEKMQAALAQARIQFKGQDKILAPIEAAGTGH